MRIPSVRWFEAAALATSLGFEFAAAVGVPCFAGYWIDRWLGWPPVGFTMLLGAAGAVAGFLMMVRTLRAFERRGQDRNKTSG